MIRRRRLVALLACAGCQTAAPEAEVRAGLQQQLDASFRLEVQGRAIGNGRPIDVAEAAIWSGDTNDATTVESDGDGRFSAVFVVPPGPDPLPRPRLHVVDREGRHWHGWLPLSGAPALGRFRAGDCPLIEEGEAASGEVVDDAGRPVPGAAVLIVDGHHDSRTFRTTTDAEGRFRFCQMLPMRSEPDLIISHPGFAPVQVPVTSRVELQRGVEVRGTVNLQAGIEAADLEVFVPIHAFIRRRADCASLSSPVAPDGSFLLRQVPRGTHEVCVRDRASRMALGPVQVVEAPPSHPPALTLWPDAAERRGPPRIPLRLQLVDGLGRPVQVRNGWIAVTDVGVAKPIHEGRIDCGLRCVGEPIGLRIPGYEETATEARRDGATVVLRGGHRLALRLALPSARCMPPGCDLQLHLQADDRDSSVGLEDPDSDSCADHGTVLRIDRDALMTVARPGLYRPHLVLRRRGGSSCSVPVTPSSFTVTGGDQRQLVVLAADFAAATAMSGAGS